MPAMVAKIADSADSPIRYDITMSAFPNAGLEDHWRNRRTRQLLAQGGFQVSEMERGYVAGPRIGSYLYRGIARPGATTAGKC